MLSEMSQPRNDKYRVTPLTRGVANSQAHRSTGSRGGFQEPGEGEREKSGELFLGMKFHMHKMKQFWKSAVPT